MLTAPQLYDSALSILDTLLDTEDDLENSARLNAMVVELSILKHRRTVPNAHTRNWLDFLDFRDKHSM